MCNLNISFIRLSKIRSISIFLKKVYKRGHSVDGRPAYSGLLLFKMLLLGIWYGLSDEKVEESVNENLSMMWNVHLAVCDDGLGVGWLGT